MKSILLLQVLILPYLAFADTFTATNGNWNDNSTWVRTNAGVFVANIAPEGSVPAIGDTILIPAGITVDIEGFPNTTSIDDRVVINLLGTIDFISVSSRLSLDDANSIIQIGSTGRISTSGSPSETLAIGSGPTKKPITGPDIDNLVYPNQLTNDTLGESPPQGCAESGTCDEDPLPVELLFFEAYYNNDRVVELSWATATEENFEFFEVSRSLDGKDFEIIGTVAGNGNTTTRHDYSFQDPAPYSGLNYYRLKSVDYDGYTEIFPLVALQLNDQLNPKVFPNPSNGYQLKFRGLDGLNPFDIEIISLDGKSHFFKKGVSENTLNLNPSLSPGLYIINTTVGNQNFSQRLIIR